jgi:hypothetical protein
MASAAKKFKPKHPSADDYFATEDVPEMAKYFEGGGFGRKDIQDSVIARAKNLEGHDAMTEKAMASIKRSKLRADAKAPGAGLYAKSRAKLNEVTGFKKGGSTASKRADGCATKGKTKGRFV